MPRLKTKTRFDQVILAAPDVATGQFRDLAPGCLQVSTRTTLYTSLRDRAVEFSAAWAKAPRAGFAPPITVLDGIDTVEVSKVDVTLLGHGYYAEARPLLDDLQKLFLYNQEPSLRGGMTSECTPEGKTYWAMRWGQGAALALYFASYNFCRMHKSIRMTPAMAAGITRKVWTMADLLAAASPAA
jgi:Alpha/beta hydrolase of unknown function (DUF900)